MVEEINERIGQDVAQGPVLSYRVRKPWKNRFTISWPSKFYKTILHSLFYETPEVLSPGSSEYWNRREQRVKDLWPPAL